MMGRIIGYVFFGVFAIASIGAFIGISWEPLSFWLTNGYWNESPSKIILGCVFLITHGGVGFGGLIYLWNTPDNSDDLPNQDPSSPWLSKTYWASPIIESDVSSSSGTIRKIAYYFIAVSTIVCFIIFESLKFKDYDALYGLIIPGIAYFIFWWSQRLENRLAIYGLMPLTLDPHPASIGGQCGGTITINRINQNIHFSQLELKCVRHYKSGKNSQTSVVWNEKMVPAWKNTIDGHELAFCFDLEEGLIESDIPEGRSYYDWEITIQAELEDGSKIRRRYNHLPVFRTAKQSRISNKQALASQSKATQQMHEAFLDKIMPFEKNSTGDFHLFYPAGRNKWGFLFALVGAIFFVVGALVDQIVFNIAFPILGGSVFVAGIYSLANSLDITINPISIETKRYIFGKLIKSKSLASYALKEFITKKTHNTSTGKQTTQYYNIVAKGTEGEELIVVENIEGMGQAKAAIKRLREMMKS